MQITDTVHRSWGGVITGNPLQLGLSNGQLLIGAGAVVIAAAALIIVTGYTHPRWTGFAPSEEWESDPDAAAAKTRRYALVYGVAFVFLGLLFLVAAVLR